MRITDTVKLDVALVGQSLSNTNVTGRYFDMGDTERACFHLIGGALADTKVTTLAIYQATDEAGSGAKTIPATSPTATCTVTSPAKVTEATIALATAINTNVVTINGLTFTAHTNTTTKATRTFSIASSDTAAGTELAACINDATYGVPGVVAVNVSGTVTLRSKDGQGTITITAATPTTITPAATKYQAFVTLNAADLDIANSFRYVAAKVTTDGVSVCAVSLLRSGIRHSPKQQVGASATI